MKKCDTGVAFVSRDQNIIMMIKGSSQKNKAFEQRFAGGTFQAFADVSRKV